MLSSADDYLFAYLFILTNIKKNLDKLGDRKSNFLTVKYCTISVGKRNCYPTGNFDCVVLKAHTIYLQIFLQQK